MDSQASNFILPTVVLLLHNFPHTNFPKEQMLNMFNVHDLVSKMAYKGYNLI